MNARAEIRIVKKSPIFIATKSAVPGSVAPHQVELCQSLDLSTNGLCVIMDKEVPLGAVYQIFVDLGAISDIFHLSAQVKWIRPSQEGVGFKVGLALFESDDTDILQWKQQMAETMLEADID